MRYPALLLVLAGACAAQVSAPAPAPRTLTTPYAPSVVVQIAAAELTAAGFEVTDRDPARGRLAAQLTRTPAEHGLLVACDEASLLTQTGRTTLVANVIASRVDSGSAVQLLVRAITRRDGAPGMFRNGAASTAVCVSTGLLEDRLTSRLQ